MTLPEFLLARIAEDEGWRWHIDYCRALDDGACDCHATARVLAESEAKRRIVSDHDSVHECPSGPNLVSDPSYEDGTYGGPCGTLQALAAVYADHPDYPGNGA